MRSEGSSAEGDVHEGADAADGHRDSVYNEALQADATVQAVEEPSDSFDFGDDGHQSMGVMSVDAFLEEETSGSRCPGWKTGRGSPGSSCA